MTANPAITETLRKVDATNYNFASKACGYCKETRSKAQYSKNPDFCTKCVLRGNTTFQPRQTRGK